MDTPSENRIKPYAANPRYWQYQGKPVLLLGGSKDDNLFQIPDLEAHLDQMREVGANYIRNTMSARDEGNVRPFLQLESGKYDLTQWEPEYWRRLDSMLELTAGREIFVQIELWDQWDHTVDRWNLSPWNPDHNVNYDAAEVTLKGDGHYREVFHDKDQRHDLFMTVPEAQNDQVVLEHQRRFIDKVLDHAFEHDHVLYTITNEFFSQHPEAWPRYWIKHLRDRAAKAGKRIEVTEMFQLPDVQSPQHRPALDEPEVFSYVELSQNAGQKRQTHWDRLQWARDYIAGHPRPINHTKIYGCDDVKWTGGHQNGVDRFWRNLIGGAASSRFHRPPAGLGLSEEAQTHIRSARMLAAEIDLFTASPDAQSERLADREPDEAYLSFIPGKVYAVFFPAGGAVKLDARDAAGPLTLRWLDIAASAWGEAIGVQGGDWLALQTPREGRWAAVLQRD